ncbi:MAG TPA: hypothetical protein VFE36_14335 [Candidatus Baltobacteraceae bacterium]|nr:hypothetical protein [Candidatus Baltobacteraceae bacterium]
MKRIAIAVVLAAGCYGRAIAGPPFLTDDPVPVEFHDYEVYLSASSDVSAAGTTVDGPVVEVTYGVAPNTQLSVAAPYAFQTPTGGSATSGYGDTEVGLKYRFVQETRWSPQIATYPAIELPSGNAAAGLGNGRTWYRLPVWAQKSWGPWTSYGGGGYAFNDAPGQRSYAFGGWQVQRNAGKALTLGGEIYYQGATTIGGRYETFYNVGGYYKPSDTVNVLFSVGHTIAGDDHAIGYIGLYFAIRSKSERSSTEGFSASACTNWIGCGRHI